MWKAAILSLRRAAGPNGTIRLLEFAHELSRVKVDIIVISGNKALHAAKGASGAIPPSLLLRADQIIE